jgi:hypothetical protein
MATAQFTGPSVIGPVPAVKKFALNTNYIDFTSSGTNWAQQYLPELYEQEVDRYGNRTISGFLSMLSAEMPMQSDQVIWSEQGRLHLAYEGQINPVDGSVDTITDIDTGGSTTHSIRKGATVVAVVNSVVFKAYVNQGIESATAAYKNGTKLDLFPYGAENVNDLAGIADTDNQAIKFFVYGSEFSKGTDTMTGAIEPGFKTFTNKPIIIKDHFEIVGSDTAQIGWVEVTGEDGQGGYLWYLKSSGDTKSRFVDYMEMTLVEAEKVVKSGTPTADSKLHDLADSPLEGTEGLFAAINSRGIVADAGLFDAESTAQAELADFDLLLLELDKQGAIEENMLYLNRAANLHIDDLLGNVSSGANGGTAFGVFENSEDMALNLGFTGFRRGSYDFYKTDWKYLNNSSTRGLVGGCSGVLIPAGTSSVYDQQVGANVRKPFLHVRYRAGQADDRKMKSWVTGSVGGPTSSNIDKMEINYLSERCLVVQAANNFVFFKS